MGPHGQISRVVALAPGELCRSEVGLVFRSPTTKQTCLMLGLSDIDGTLNNEHVLESERIHTISPAKEAVHALQSRGVTVGICTARAKGEAEMYAHAVGARGILISENGACTTYPDGKQVTIGDMREIQECIAAIEARLGRTLVSTLNPDALEERWFQQCVARKVRAASVVADPENDLGHATREALRLSASRGASAYISGLTPEERVVAIALAESYGFRPFGDLLHLINRRADKGIALDGLCEGFIGEELSVFDSNGGQKRVRIERVAPIVFGNGENDLPLFTSAIERGGYGVLVGDPVKPSGFHFDLNAQPPHPKTLITHGAAFGYGMRAAIFPLSSRIWDDYGISLG